MTGACTLSGSTTGRFVVIILIGSTRASRADDARDVDLLVPFRCAQQPFRSVLSLAFAAASVCHWDIRNCVSPAARQRLNVILHPAGTAPLVKRSSKLSP